MPRARWPQRTALEANVIIASNCGLAPGSLLGGPELELHVATHVFWRTTPSSLRLIWSREKRTGSGASSSRSTPTTGDDRRQRLVADSVRSYTERAALSCDAPIRYRLRLVRLHSPTFRDGVIVIRHRISSNVP